MPRIKDLAGRPLLLGTATSAYQIEGATEADGRGRSIWDTFAARPGTVRDGTDGSVACGSYERLDDDLELLGDLRAGAYRFSIAWPRVQPTGSGPSNPAGLDYYDRVVDGLLARGVTPLPTLYHWDLPQPLEDAGGWPARDTAYRFADYARLVHGRLGDRVPTWATHNEPWCAAFLGYAAGVHAPGRTEPAAAFASAHHLLLSHGLAAAALRDGSAEVEVGIVLNLNPVHVEDPAAAQAAHVVDLVQNEMWLSPLLDGTYPPDLVARVPGLGDPGLVREGDLDAVRGSLDWLGVNYYTPFRVGAADRTADGGVGQTAAAYPTAPPFAFQPRPPLTTMGWEVDPSGLQTLLEHVAGRAPGLPLAVTENGAAFPDGHRAKDGSVQDDDRVAYLRDHIAAVQAARDSGADVRAYLAWSLLDNYEWAEGYAQRFGLVEVEPGTLRRVPKASYRFLAETARATSG